MIFFCDVEAFEMVQIFDVASIITRKTKFEPLNRPLILTAKASIEVELKLEIKATPSHLKHAFLGDDDIILIILSVGLSEVQVNEALTMLKSREKVLIWKILDIKAINPILRMHKIFMQEDHKLSVQHQ